MNSRQPEVTPLKLFWIAWINQPDPEPIGIITDPPILGYWNLNNQNRTMAALVAAENEQKAKTAVLLHWPQAANNWFVCTQKSTTYVTLPSQPWSQKRMHDFNLRNISTNPQKHT